MTTPSGSSLATTVNLSGNSTLDSLLIGTKWASGFITYSFATSSSVWSTNFFTGYGTAFSGNEPYTGFGTLTSSDQTFTTQALSSWSNVSNLTFVQVADNASTVGDIRFAFSSLLSNAQAWAYSPGNAAIAGDVWFNSNGSSNYYNWTQGSYEFLTVVHELGHALGLDHPFGGTGKIAAALPQDQDYLWNTVMSYSAQPGQTSAYLDFYPTTPMGIDIQAMQYLYGANTSYHAGNDTYTFLQGSHYLETIWDAGGIDTIKYIATSLGCEIDLRPGEWSQLGLGVGVYNAGRFVRTEYDTVNIYDTVIIENAIGSNFADKIYGNLANNHLSGGGGNDTLDGGDGADILYGGYGVDIMTGGLGNDSLDGNDNSDIYIIASATEHTQAEFSDSGNIYYTDEVRFTATDTLGGSTLTLYAGDTGIERVVIGTGTATTAISTDTVALNIDATTLLNALTIKGNAGNNMLAGTNFNDTVNGGAGADNMIGGAGDDIYIVDNTLDTVTEVDGEGTDSIQSSITYSLVDTDGAGSNGGNVENLTLTGFTNINATGNTQDNILIGNSGANTLTGDLGNDTLDGGEAADNMIGGVGNDTYFVDNALDIVTEADAEGNDTVNSSVTYSLADGGFIENLTLIGVANINATGNALNNILIGNGSANIIAGNLGDDTMIGGDGNDIYLVDSALDIVTETNDVQLTGGIDEVQSNFTYTLGLNIEKLTLTGSDHINGTGNSLNNTIVGNAGNNSLDGSTGIDTLQGGLGNDIYTVDLMQTGTTATTYRVAQQDTLIEAANAGNDSLILRGNFNHITASTITLAATIENLDASQTGTTKLNLTGNALNNNFIGNSAANVISGGKGDDVLNGLAGIDTLTGGLGNDTYYVNIIQAGADAAVLEDVVTELSTAGSGTDTLILQGSLSLTNATTLILADTLEHVDASASANTKLNLTGNNASNTLTGNAADNRLFGLIGDDMLIGNAGNDVLNGGVGIDTLKGGAGNDTYVIDNIADIIDEEANLDTSDTVKYGINASAILTSTLTIGSSNTNEVKLTAQTSANLDLTQIENLTITGTGKYNLVGNDADNILTGNAGANSILGGAGNDTLNGGAGLDTLNGGDGNDEYFVDSVAEANLITDSSGIDTLNIGLTYTLTDPLENLTLIGIMAINGTGNAADNIIRGNDAANILDGKAGADTLSGGKGNDTYLVDNISDTVIETLTLAQSGGIDTVRISAGYTGTNRVAEDNVDNLDASLFANGIHLTGNNLANILTGGAGNDTLDGGAGNDVLKGGAGNDTLDGGAGIDTLKGGTGDDVYHIDLKPFVIGSSFSVAEDIISEELAGGIDTLVLYGESFGYQLNANIENLDLSQLTNNQFWTYGNGLNNDIQGHATFTNNLDGGAGNDTLHGGTGRDYLIGGVGADLLIGGDNSDYYEVDNLGDQIIDDGVFGFDRIVGKISIDLRNFSNIEEVELKYGAGNLNATGNDFSNVVSGNDGNNILDGGAGNDTVYGNYGNDTIIGGLGADTLLGGSGADIFDFNAINESGFGINRDVIFGFSHTEKNKIDFSTIDANEALGGNQAFAFIWAADFSHVAGELRYVGGDVTGSYNNGFFTDTFTGGTLSGDVNGDGLADFEIVMIGVTSLALSDFTL